MDLEIFNCLKQLPKFNFNHRTGVVNIENTTVTVLKKFAFESSNKRMGAIVEW